MKTKKNHLLVYTCFMIMAFLSRCFSHEIKSSRIRSLLLAGSSAGGNDKPDTPTVAAPMVAASDFAFRSLCRQHGVDLCFTQMLHAKNVVHDESFRRNHFDFYEYRSCGTRALEIELLSPAQKNFLGEHYLFTSDDSSRLEIQQDWQTYTNGPLVVQLAGNDADTVVQAAKTILEHSPQVEGFDLNCGCPQGIARKGNYGAFLMEQDSDKVFHILESLRRELPEHITVSNKIRLPTSDRVLRERVLRLVDTGIDFLTIHGRTLKENKTNVRHCHFDRIKLAIDTIHEVHPEFPVCSNGGIEYRSDIASIIDTTGAAAIMSSEALLETPNVFQVDISQLSPREILAQQLSFARDYLQWCRLFPPLPGVLGHAGGCFNVCRGHLFKILYRYLNENTDLRDQLASHKTQTLQHAYDIVDELDRRYCLRSDSEFLSLRSSNSDSSWYRRHRSPSNIIDCQTAQANSSTDALAMNPQLLSVKERKDMIRARISNLRNQNKQQC